MRESEKSFSAPVGPRNAAESSASIGRRRHALHRCEKTSGRGLGWIDVPLLATALVSRARLWTLDKQLNLSAAQLSLRDLDPGQ
jgi:hypothetical protein